MANIHLIGGEKGGVGKSLVALLLQKLKGPLRIPDLFERLKDRARKREQNYDDQQKKLNEAATGIKASAEKALSKQEKKEEPKVMDAAQSEVVAKISEVTGGAREVKPWWGWESEAAAEPDMNKRDAIYKRALEALPNEANLLGNYAVFLNNLRKDYEAAERYYKKSLEADSKHAANLGNYAAFLHELRKDYPNAELYYKMALEVDPKNAVNLGNYALFLHQVRNNYVDAERYYKMALEVDPKNALNLGNYAVFLFQVRKNNDEAAQYCKQAVDADPKNAINLANYAQLLFIAGRDQEAKRFLQNAENIKGENESLSVDLSFYRLAHLPESWPVELGNMKRLLKGGARSPGSDFSGNLNRARMVGHLNFELLKTLAKVLSEGTAIEELEKFEEWREA